MAVCVKHKYSVDGRSGNRKTYRFRCSRCGMKIAIPIDVLRLFIMGKAKRLRARHIHEISR